MMRTPLVARSIARRHAATTTRDEFKKAACLVLQSEEKLCIEAAGQLVSTNNNRVYLQVPFREKDEAKKLGARFDAEYKLWYFDQGARDRFAKWPLAAAAAAAFQSSKRVYLQVPFREKDDAKQLGARYDPSLKQWYFLENHSNAAVFARWARKTDAQRRLAGGLSLEEIVAFIKM